MNYLPPLGDITVEQFLDEYWQKKPLFVRGAFADFACPVEPEELAGLALEEEVESRLLREKGGEKPWELRHGPFVEEDFTGLPDDYWTLLVQEANKHVPELALLQDRFSFIPNWRLDDVMVSYAADQGSVGPHADNYDVFLIQGAGRRRWQINTTPPGPDDLIPELPVRIMRHFEAEQEWIVEPGDLLYLPPGVAHHGVAQGESITISVGFRAPSETDILSQFLAEQLAQMDPERFYSDPDLAQQSNPGLIADSAKEKVRAIIRSLPLDDASIDSWFAAYVTEPRPGHDIPEPEQPIDADTLRGHLSHGEALWRSEYCRFAYSEDQGATTLYVAGEAYPLTIANQAIAPLLCAQRYYTALELQPMLDEPSSLELLLTLYNRGALYFPEEG